MSPEPVAHLNPGLDPGIPLGCCHACGGQLYLGQPTALTCADDPCTHVCRPRADCRLFDIRHVGCWVRSHEQHKVPRSEVA
jgi:hypothetical protein